MVLVVRGFPFYVSPEFIERAVMLTHHLLRLPFPSALPSTVPGYLSAIKFHLFGHGCHVEAQACGCIRKQLVEPTQMTRPCQSVRCQVSCKHTWQTIEFRCEALRVRKLQSAIWNFGAGSVIAKGRWILQGAPQSGVNAALAADFLANVLHGSVQNTQLVLEEVANWTNTIPHISLPDTLAYASTDLVSIYRCIWVVQKIRVVFFRLENPVYYVCLCSSPYVWHACQIHTPALDTKGPLQSLVTSLFGSIHIHQWAFLMNQRIKKSFISTSLFLALFALCSE